MVSLVGLVLKLSDIIRPERGFVNGKSRLAHVVSQSF
jgi:hypothetical protein